MAKAKHTGPAVLTANHLLSGAVVFWTGTGWSPRLDEAERAADADARAALDAVGLYEEAANTVVGAYLVVLDEAGTPVALRERQRLAGPLATLAAA